MGGTRRSEWPMIRRAISGNLVELARILATAGPISGRLFSSSDDAGPALRSKRTERCVRNVAYGTLADIFGHFAPMLPSPLHEAGVSPTTALARPYECAREPYECAPGAVDVVRTLRRRPMNRQALIALLRTSAVVVL